MYALTLLSLSVFVGQSVSSVIDARSAITGLLKRQAGFDPSSIPPQCTQACSSIVSTLNTCSQVSCLCTESANNGLYSCLECAIGLAPSIISESQTNLAEYEDSCKQAGAAVNSLTLTLPSGATATASGTSRTTSVGSVGTTTAAGSSPTTTRAGSATTSTDDDDDDETDTSSVDDPLETGGATKGNGAGSVAGSSAALLSAVFVAIGALMAL